MIEEFRLPDLGEGLPEAELVHWLVAAGDTVALNQAIAEVETAKAVVELPSPYAGRVAALHAQPGDVIPVGSALIDVEVGGATEAPVPNLVGYGAAPGSSARPHRRARVARDRAAATDTAVLEAAPHDALPTPAPVETPPERPRSTPPVRKLARDLGVDLALVEASGVRGVITRHDVEEYAERVTPAVLPASDPAPPTDDGRDRRIPIRGVRRTTADAMVRSAFTAPHVTTFHTVDVTATMEFIGSLRTEGGGARVGVLAVAAKAVCLALRRTPQLNARWDAAAGEIVEYGAVHLGIAVATERGLVVPNLRDAGRLSLPELAEELGSLAETARAGRTSTAAMRGGTFTITNVGVFGVEAGTPILNPGESGILALGAVQRRPWEHRGEIALRDVMTLSLSFDHRVVDGAEGARFLMDVAGILHDPARALLY